MHIFYNLIYHIYIIIYIYYILVLSISFKLSIHSSSLKAHNVKQQPRRGTAHGSAPWAPSAAPAASDGGRAPGGPTFDSAAPRAATRRHGWAHIEMGRDGDGDGMEMVFI
jgi:hypothetical protein